MADASPQKPSRRTFLKRSAMAGAVGAGALGAAGAYWVGGRRRASRALGKKVIVIGVDGMDPRLCEGMMAEGLLPNLSRLRDRGGFSDLGTSIPPQSPVAWANFINGAGPGSHGIFDFVHRHPHEQCAPFYSAAETVDGKTVLRREGVPFWDYLDAAGIPSTFYDLPSNYPPSPSHHGHHRSIAGMGTPDMLGSYGTYQHFADNNPLEGGDDTVGKLFVLSFENDKADGKIVGPTNTLLAEPEPINVPFNVYRDRAANAALVEVRGQKILLKAGEWSRWTRLKFPLAWYVPDVSGICRFYLQEVSPNFKLYVTPINIDPSAPAVQLSEPASFIQNVSKDLGLFYTTGFQEDYNARKDGVFRDDEFLHQANLVLEERLSLFDYAVDDYDDGLLFFYFSSSDLQSHIFWWTSNDKHPVRSDGEAKKYFGHVRQLYQRLDALVGDLYDRYGAKAAIIVMSDHGFSNFAMQFNLNSWLRDAGYLGPPECTSIMKDVDWSQTVAYGLGLNGLYLNLKGRERDGIVEPGEQQESLLTELSQRLEGVTDSAGQKVIRNVYRADKVYSGDATALAPDLIVGYARGYRASWATSKGDLTSDWLLPNDSAWSADHCADALEVPGLLVTNRPIRGRNPKLVDLAPSILGLFGLNVPSSMTGKDVFEG
ncbi:MAG TPA: alkaline phosphatase family protein [Pirellulales bacterium]|jgi:predicted AlkP superfamily phosphohydrolase/phosphomutase|nr:alkaline phosphatase family protein [Pirellulales bacterium]